ncbi:MAG: RNA-directed DNA polymerase, partial [Bacteroidota bacterium]
MDNLRLAFENAKRGKKHYREVKKIEKNPSVYLLEIQKALRNKTYKTSKYEIMTKITDSGKSREIHKLPFFPDRIVHHAIMQVTENIWFRTLIRDTYSSLKGRGIHDGVKRVRKALKNKKDTRYCLKFDIKKYYPSIDNGILKKVIRKKIKDNDLLWLLDEIIDSTSGVPIGNYLSQYFGNLFLSDFDHLMKEKYRCKNYFRYCDDVVILSDSKEFLHFLRRVICKLLKNIKLKIKQNWQVFPVCSRGLDFLGYRFFHGYTLLRDSIKQKFIKKVRLINSRWAVMSVPQVVSSIMSYYGWFKYANCMNLSKKHIDKN